MTTNIHTPIIYYYMNEDTRVVFWYSAIVEDRPDLIFLGSSRNPNKKMAVAAFVKGSDREFGYTLQELPFE